MERCAIGAQAGGELETRRLAGEGDDMSASIGQVSRYSVPDHAAKNAPKIRRFNPGGHDSDVLATAPGRHGDYGGGMLAICSGGPPTDGNCAGLERSQRGRGVVEAREG